jgi:RNA polymerase sigma factor (sigma-70 family)
MPVTEALEQVPDSELIAAVREGDVAAFAVLYERHLVPAKRAAACLANTPAEREDLVAEAFTRVLRMLREGRGPDEEFRPYLLVTLRNTAISAATRGVPVSLYADVPDVLPVEGVDDPVIDRWHASVAADAFASLPERWRVVLWHTEVEESSPAAVAPLLGMRPNSVAALAYRAREGLRQAYLRMHTPEAPRPECRTTVNKLAGYVRHSLPLPLSRRIGRHLTECAECRSRVAALTNVNDELRGLLSPLVLGAPLAASYLPVSAAASGAAASGPLVAAAASEAVTSAVSGLLAAKAAVVQVVTALAVATTAVSMTSSAPARPAPADAVPIAGLRLPVTAHDTTAFSGQGALSLTRDEPALQAGTPTATDTPAGLSAAAANTTTGTTTSTATDASTDASTGTATDTAGTTAKQDKAAAKQARKAAKQAARAGATTKAGSGSDSPPAKSKKAKKVKTAKKATKK